jgi:hypothetical protein
MLLLASAPQIRTSGPQSAFCTEWLLSQIGESALRVTIFPFPFFWNAFECASRERSWRSEPNLGVSSPDIPRPRSIYYSSRHPRMPFLSSVPHPPRDRAGAALAIHLRVSVQYSRGRRRESRAPQRLLPCSQLSISYRIVQDLCCRRLVRVGAFGGGGGRE